MIRVMIVDDDRNYRYAVREIIPWEEHGFSIVAEAVHGKQALVLLVQQPVELIITDISMPQMDGVELIRAVRQRDPSIILVALSAYDDFDYVRSAMKSGAFDYVLKYEMEDRDMLKTVGEARRRILAARSAPSGARHAHPFLRLFFTEPEEAAYSREIRQYFHTHGVRSTAPQLGVMAVEFAGEAGEPCREPPEAELTGAVEESPVPLLYTVLENRGLVVVFHFGDMAGMQEMQRVMAAFATRLRLCGSRWGQGTVTTGTGPVVMGYRNLRDSCEKALEALEQQLYDGPGRDYRHGDVRRGEGLDNEEQVLLRALEAGELSGLEELSGPFWDAAKRNRPAAAELDRSIVNLFLAMHAGAPGAPPLSAEAISRWTGSLGACRTLEAKRALLLGEAETLAAGYPALYSRHVQLAVAFIRGHYRENLTLRDIADHVELSPNYLSSLFKLEVGERIMGYVNRVRIERAKELIRSGRLKVYEVAGQVGFDSSSYFSTMFKKYTGFTVNEYRNGDGKGKRREG